MSDDKYADLRAVLLDWVNAGKPIPTEDSPRPTMSPVVYPRFICSAEGRWQVQVDPFEEAADFGGLMAGVLPQGFTETEEIAALFHVIRAYYGNAKTGDSLGLD